MPALDRASALAYMKERWIDPDELMLAIMTNAPLLGLLERDHKAMVGGRYMHIPLLRVGAQGRSASYVKAVTNLKSSETVGFDVTYVSNYQAIQVDGDTIDDMEGSENAIAEAVDHETEAAIANMRKDLQMSVFGQAGGPRGRIGSIGAGLAGANCRITLSNPTDSKFFEEGMVLAASANDGSGAAHALRDSGNVITITGINKMLGYLEFASDVTASISGLTANDYLFADGDFKTKWSGLAGWIPTTDPTAGDSFHGVDRSVATQVLSGLRYDATGKPIEEGLIAGAGYADLFDAHFDLGVINPVRFSRLVTSFMSSDRGNRITKVEGNGRKAVVGYSAVMIATAFGDVPFVSDGGCGINEGFGLTKSTWKIGHVGGEGNLVHVVQDDKNRLRRPAGASAVDAWQLDLKCRGNMGCKSPGKNMRYSFSSLS